MKKVFVIIMCVMLLICTTSCIKDDTSETSRNTSEQENISETTDNNEQQLQDESWKSAYLAYLDELYSDEIEEKDLCTYSLIYVDDDDIPELVIDTGYSAGGCLILTYHDNTLDALQTARTNFTYIEKNNLLCNSDGHMGYYYDIVYVIQNGKWECIAKGTYEDSEEGVQLDEDGNYIFVYEWDGKEVEKSEYEDNLNAVYQTNQVKHPEKYYIFDEILSLLKTNHVMSANHRYELIVEDITWTDARYACEKKGGYLATITSWEEFNRIQSQILSEEKKDITFYVGAANNGKHLDSTGLNPE